MLALIASVVTVALATASLFYFRDISGTTQRSFHKIPFIDAQIKYQGYLLAFASFVAIVTWVLNPTNFRTLFRLGDLSAPAEAVTWIGIQEGESWRTVGPSMCFFITLATASFVFFQVKSAGGFSVAVFQFLPWIVLFSLTNSFAEEIIYRLGIIAPSFRLVPSSALLIISATVFGAAHVRGMPNGVIGIVMAGFLGWFLAKSLIETQGMFWAWLIHFTQDIVIFSGLFLIEAKTRDG